MPPLGAVSSPTQIATVLSATLNWDPALITKGDNISQDVTVPGAVVGDPAVAGFTSIVTAGWQLTANVTAADTVTVLLTNHTGQHANLPGGVLTVMVFKL